MFSEPFQVRFDNIRDIEAHLLREGYGPAGLSVRWMGAIAERGIRLGTLEGDIRHARLGDWIAFTPDGFQLIPGHQLHDS